MKTIRTLILFPIILFINIQAQLNYIDAFPNLSFDYPVDIQHAGDGTNRLFVVEQEGRILVFENDAGVGNTEIFLDISNQVLFGGEQGLLGLAFHPNFEQNGYFYVDYTADNPRRTVISRFTADPSNPNTVDPESELIILEVDQPYGNHNGGQISFGPDGYLYIAFGDGGSGGDPQGNGQNLSTILGSIIRIDVDNTGSEMNYGIPEDNPFAGNTEGYREEIYAYGLRNPWRFSFDPETELLWAADVGQNEYEEINIIEKGNNYGWNIMEGLHCFEPSTGCDTSGLTMPVWEYDHGDGQSVTGGFVYRGSSAQEISGDYIYADFVSGRIWAFAFFGNPANRLLFNTDLQISTFGVDQNQELYFASFSDGKIYKFQGEPTAVDNEQLEYEFRLFQNYPNPFNPETSIEYQVARREMITLKVYDILGNELKTLVDKIQAPGSYKIRFDASELPSGVYFCKLTAGSLTETRKMIVLK